MRRRNRSRSSRRICAPTSGRLRPLTWSSTCATTTAATPASPTRTLASRIDQWTGAIFVGEPTGSRPNHFGNEVQFVLPHSGLRGTISSGWNQPISGRDDRIWIAPEIPVKTEALDYFAGRDPVLERILSEIGRQK
jgi:hypothetical protein